MIFYPGQVVKFTGNINEFRELYYVETTYAKIIEIDLTYNKCYPYCIEFDNGVFIWVNEAEIELIDN